MLHIEFYLTERLLKMICIAKVNSVQQMKTRTIVLVFNVIGYFINIHIYLYFYEDKEKNIHTFRFL